jgi:nucleotide-binding universal stress UspA family protein
MSKSSAKYGVLVCVDGSAASNAAIAWGAHEAVERQLPITLLHVVPPVVAGWPVGHVYPEMPDWQKDDAQTILEQAFKLAASRGESKHPEIHTKMVYSSVVPALIDASKDAWMIVVGTQGLGALGRLLLGSVTTELLHHAYCPVAVIRSDEVGVPDPKAPVLVGIDGSPASEAATALAFEEASWRGVDLTAVHVWSDVGVFPVLGLEWRDRERQGKEILAERLAGWQEQYPDVHVERLLFCDKPSHWILDASGRAQLVVVGSRGRGGFPGLLLGSVSSAVAHAAEVPVIVVR